MRAPNARDAYLSTETRWDEIEMLLTNPFAPVLKVIESHMRTLRVESTCA